MKKSFALFLSAAIMLSVCGCGGTQAPAAAEGEKKAESTTEAATEETAKKALPAAPAAEAGAAEAEEGHYKSIMKPYDQITHGKRIVILQSCIVYSRDGFYTEDTIGKPETITYDGNEVSAYALTHPIALLNEVPSGDVTVYSADGSNTVVSAEEFSGMYAIIDDFQSGNPAVLYHPENNTVISDFDYAIMANGEGIISMVTEQERNVNDLLVAYGWDNTLPYHLVATDYFYVPITPEDYDEGGIRGALSGSINASFPDMTIAMGKLNDVICIEEVVE